MIIGDNYGGTRMIYICINEDYSDYCELFSDLDDDETDYLWCDEQGVCSGDYESCPYYTPCLDEED